MNIAIDITPLQSGHAIRGVGVYTKSLIESLQRYESKHSYSFFTHKQIIPKTADLVHYPYFDPFFLTLPLHHSIPTVVTVHDLIPLVFPDKFPAGFRGMIKWNIQKIALKRINRVLTVSECSKNDISKFVGVRESAIDVVYSAPPAVFKRITDSHMLEHVKTKYSLPDNFFVYVGDVNWNKNIPGMLRAFEEFSKTTNASLILVGKPFLDEKLPETKHIHELVKTLKLEHRIQYTGFVSDDDLSCIYSLATGSLELSFYEGFGLPVLESMACGCPAVVSNNSSLVEIAGPSVQVDAYNYKSMMEGMKKVISLSKEQRKQLVTEGIQWSHQFSWEKTAKQTVAVYEKVLG